MKRLSTVPIVAILFVMIFMVYTGSSVEAKELKFAVFEPPKADAVRLVIMPFTKMVEKATHGGITWRVFPGGSLLGARDVLSGIRDGVTDVGSVVPPFLVSSLPHANLTTDLLAFASNAVQAAGASNETLLLDCPGCVEDYRKMNAVSFGGYAPSPSTLQCTKPVTKLSDVRGMKIRVAGAAWGRWVKAMGAAPVGMPPTQIATAMQRGQVDCALAVRSWLWAFGLGDSVKYIIDFPQGNFHGLGIFTFNQDIWNGLSRGEKGMILHAVPKAIAYGTIQSAFHEEPAIFKKIVARKKITVTSGDAAFAAAFQKYKSKEVDAVIAGAKKRGIKNPGPVVKAHLANLKKWEKLAKEIGSDVDKFEKMLWNEVYSKLKY